MNDVRKGVKEAITGIIMGITLTTIVDSLVKDGYSKWFFVLIGIAGSIGIIKRFKFKGVFYVIGWVIGSWLLRDLFGPADYAFYIVVPIVITAWFWIKGRGSGG